MRRAMVHAIHDALNDTCTRHLQGNTDKKFDGPVGSRSTVRHEIHNAIFGVMACRHALTLSYLTIVSKSFEIRSLPPDPQRSCRISTTTSTRDCSTMLLPVILDGLTTTARASILWSSSRPSGDRNSYRISSTSCVNLSWAVYGGWSRVMWTRWTPTSKQACNRGWKMQGPGPGPGQDLDNQGQGQGLTQMPRPRPHKKIKAKAKIFNPKAKAFWPRPR